MTIDRAKLKEWRKSLTLDPLDPSDERYVRLADAGTTAVDEILSTIQLAFEPTVQLLSGPSGSGKTTELRRLAGRLRKEGYAVVRSPVREPILAGGRHRILDRARARARGRARRRWGRHR